MPAGGFALLSWAPRLAAAPLFARAHGPLLAAGLVVLGLGALLALGLAVDDRTLNGVSVWLKPVKFHLSVGLYFATLALVAAALPERVRRGWLVSAAAAIAIVAGTAELLYIDVQGARGLASHFNETTAFYIFAFRTMGVVAILLTAMTLPLAWAVARHGRERLSPSMRDAVVLGLVLTFALGAGAGMAIGANGGPGVGGTPGATGIPLFGWLRDGGDLRVAHFLGMHAMQALPAIGLALGATVAERAARAGVWTAAGLYTALTLWTLAEALAGRPFLPTL